MQVTNEKLVIEGVRILGSTQIKRPDLFLYKAGIPSKSQEGAKHVPEIRAKVIGI